VSGDTGYAIKITGLSTVLRSARPLKCQQSPRSGCGLFEQRSGSQTLSDSVSWGLFPVDGMEEDLSRKGDIPMGRMHFCSWDQRRCLGLLGVGHMCPYTADPKSIDFVRSNCLVWVY